MLTRKQVLWYNERTVRYGSDQTYVNIRSAVRISRPHSKAMRALGVLLVVVSPKVCLPKPEPRLARPVGIIPITTPQLDSSNARRLQLIALLRALCCLLELLVEHPWSYTPYASPKYSMTYSIVAF